MARHRFQVGRRLHRIFRRRTRGRHACFHTRESAAYVKCSTCMLTLEQYIRAISQRREPRSARGTHNNNNAWMLVAPYKGIVS